MIKSIDNKLLLIFRAARFQYQKIYFKTLDMYSNLFYTVAKESLRNNINVIAFTMDDALRYAKCNTAFL